MRKIFYTCYFLFSFFALYIYLPYISFEIGCLFPGHPFFLSYPVNNTAFSAFYWAKAFGIDLALFISFAAFVLPDVKNGVVLPTVNYSSLFIAFIIHFFPFLDLSTDLYKDRHTISILSWFSAFNFFLNGCISIVSVVLFIRMMKHRRNSK